MKTKILLIVTNILLLSFTIIAQNEKDYKQKGIKYPMNNVKINLAAIVLKNYSFQYERILTKKISFALGYRTMSKSSLPLKNLGEKIIGNEEEGLEQLKNFRLGNSAITTELRFYLSKKGYGNGFYIAPFYRNAVYKGSGLKFKYENDAKVETDVIMAGDIKSNTFGLMFGSQWHLGKHISLDWWIFGPHYGNGKGDITGVFGMPLALKDQNSLKKELEDLDIPNTTKTVTINENNVNLKLNGPFAGVRTGLLLGIRF